MVENLLLVENCHCCFQLHVWNGEQWLDGRSVGMSRLDQTIHAQWGVSWSCWSSWHLGPLPSSFARFIMPALYLRCWMVGSGSDCPGFSGPAVQCSGTLLWLNSLWPLHNLSVGSQGNSSCPWYYPATIVQPKWPSDVIAVDLGDVKQGVDVFSLSTQSSMSSMWRRCLMVVRFQNRYLRPLMVMIWLRRFRPMQSNSYIGDASLTLTLTLPTPTETKIRSTTAHSNWEKLEEWSFIQENYLLITKLPNNY